MPSPFPELPANPHSKPASRKAAKSRPAEAANKLELLQLEDRLVPAGQITGQVFLDFNSNGLLDTTTTLPNDGSGNYTRQTDRGVAGEKSHRRRIAFYFNSFFGLGNRVSCTSRKLLAQVDHSPDTTIRTTVMWLNRLTIGASGS